MKNVLTAGLSALALAAVSTAASAEGAITVVSWGGAYTKSQVEAYHKPYTDKTGTTINSVDYSGGIAEVKAQVEAGNVTWDIIDVELSDAVRGCDEGIFQKLNLDDLPAGADGTAAKDDFLPGTLHECAVANIVWSTIYAYDDSTIGDKKPATMADFFDTATWEGKRGMRKGPKPNLEFALIGDGVAASDVYAELSKPEGVDRAFAKLGTIKDKVVWWEAGAQPPQLLADGEVMMTTAYNGRIFNAAAAEDKPFVIVWDGQVWDIDLWAIPRGAPNADKAWDFLKFTTATEQLAAQASWISYGPARKSSGPLVGMFNDGKTEMAPHMPTAPDNLKNAVQNDFLWWADNQDALNERFNAWLAQ